MKKLFIFIVAVMLLVAANTAFAAHAPTAKMTQLPFKVKGTLQFNETYVIEYPTMSVSASGLGEATQLGKFTVTYQGKVNRLDFSGTHSIHFVAENGESLYAEGVSQAIETGISNVFNMVEIYKITGGTGWFNNASGTITVHRVVNMINKTQGYTSGTFEGSILIP